MSARLPLCAVLLLLPVACVDGTSPVAPVQQQRDVVQGMQTFGVVDGSTGAGSLYRFVVPENWNGSLLVYAHGYVAPEDPVALPAEADVFAGLLVPQGVALAYSSFSENGWDIKDGAQRTHQLLGLFTSKFGPPSRVYIGGASMGGLIAIKLTETFPAVYRGALAACAVAGGTRRQFDYYANVRAIFDVLYPGVLPGNATYLPAGTDITTGIVQPAVAAMTGNPAPALTLAAIDQTPVPFATGAELIQSIATALESNAGSLSDELLANGRPYFDNASTVYTSASLPPTVMQAINAAVGRFDASPSALESMDHNYAPSGDLQIPMLMLSDQRDPVVPGFNQSSYLAAVTGRGDADLLVQRQVPAYGHCAFTPGEIGTAFSDLVAWTEYGVKPTP
jgi:pimeloyl-ACP methyl ester carboxylesterase